jgi:hypothetical protein
LLGEEVERRDVDVDSLEAVHVAGPDDDVDARKGSQQRIRRGRRKRVQRASTGRVSKRKPVDPGARVRPEAVGQRAKGGRMRLERVAHGLGEVIEVIGGHSALAGAHVDHDRGLPDEVELIREDVLAGEPPLFDSAGRENDSPRASMPHEFESSSVARRGRVSINPEGRTLAAR